MAQVDLSVRMGDRYDQTVISAVENGRSSLRLDGLARAAQVLDVSSDYLLGITDDPTPATRRKPNYQSTGNLNGRADYRVVPWAQDVRSAAGAPKPVFDESAGFGIAFHRSVLPAWVEDDSLICISAAGDSMEPSLRDGDLVCLDYSKAEPLDGRVFVIRVEDGLVVKRLRRRGSAWDLVSDNPAYAPRPIGAEDRIIGRVAWNGPPRS